MFYRNEPRTQSKVNEISPERRIFLYKMETLKISVRIMCHPMNSVPFAKI